MGTQETPLAVCTPRENHADRSPRVQTSSWFAPYLAQHALGDRPGCGHVGDRSGCSDRGVNALRARHQCRRLGEAASLRPWAGLRYGVGMADLTLQYPDDLLLTSGKSRSEVERELTFQLAVRLFEVGRLSLGKAAELAGWNRLLFADELGRLQVPVINLDDGEIQIELRGLRGDHHRG